MPRASFRTYVLLGFVVWLSCFPIALADLTPDAPSQFDFRALLFPADFAVLAVIVVAVYRRRLPPLAAVAGIVLLTLAIAWLVHPSERGSFTLLRWAGVVAVAALADRRIVVALTGGWAVLESIVALAQKVNDGPLGLPPAAENPFSFVSFGDALAPPGTLVHAYLLSGLALFGGALLADAARDRRWLLVPAAVAVAPVGFTYSRAGLLALALVLVCFAVARFPAAVLALAVGAGLPALAWSDGWVTRARVTAETAAYGLDTGRSALMRQSRDVIVDHPLAGVGPGRYVTALRERGTDTRPSGGALKPVHNLPLLAAAEGGVAAGAAMAALLALAGIMALRAGPSTVAVYVAFLPFCLLDHFAYTFPQGVVMMGLWLGALSTAGRARRPAS